MMERKVGLTWSGLVQQGNGDTGQASVGGTRMPHEWTGCFVLKEVTHGTCALESVS